MWSCRGELFSAAHHSSEWWSFLYLPPPHHSIPLCPWQWTKRSVVPLAAFGARCAPCLSSALIYSCYFPLQRQALICAPPHHPHNHPPSPSHRTPQCILLPYPSGVCVCVCVKGVWWRGVVVWGFCWWHLAGIQPVRERWHRTAIKINYMGQCFY